MIQVNLMYYEDLATQMYKQATAVYAAVMRSGLNGIVWQEG